MSDSQEQSVAGEPDRQIWVGDICIEEYRDAARIVQPRDDQLVPETIIVPQAHAEDVGNAIVEMAGNARVSDR
jgi:hypothetical protein